MLKINDIFQTIQGEATYAGTPSIFIRLQYCPVGCSWCDTKFTWHNGKDRHLVSQDDIINKKKESMKFANYTASELLNVCKKYLAKHIVITGGEPCVYNLTEFSSLAIASGYSVQVETSGTFDINVHAKTWVTVSPKINMAGGYKVLDSSIARADEIKYPILKIQDINILQTLNIQNKIVWLQPVMIDENINLQLCLDACYKFGYKLSIQTHKYINQK